MKNLGLAYKFIIPLAALMLIAQIVSTVVLNNSTGAKLQVQQQDTIAHLKDAQSRAAQERTHSLEARADMIGGFLSKTAVGPILFDDKDALAAKQKSAQGHGIAYVLFLSPDGKTPLVDGSDQSARADAIEKIYPVESKGKVIGRIAVGISKQELQQFEQEGKAQVEKLTADIDAERAQVSRDVAIANLTSGLITLALLVAVIMFLFRRLVIKPLRDGRAVMEELSSGNGDLTMKLPVKNADEISSMLESINTFTDKLRTLVQDIVGSTETLTGSAGNLTTMMQESQARIDHQQQETRAVATAVHEMAATVHEVARNTATAAESAQKANDAAGKGHQTTQQAVSDINGLVGRIEQTATVINRLNEDAEQVGTVLEVIRGIAEQTNLLALNAAIEAARAGEQGRGFAVVADEVRTLAGKTQQSTEEIREIIEKLQGGSVTAVEAMTAAQESGQQGANQVHQVASALNEITQLVQQINDMNTQIASAAEEQSAVAEEINNNITRLNHLGEESAESAGASARSGMELAELAQHLHQVAGVFKV